MLMYASLPPVEELTSSDEKELLYGVVDFEPMLAAEAVEVDEGEEEGVELDEEDIDSDDGEVSVRFQDKE